MVSFVTTNIIGTATKKIDMFWNFVSGCMSILWGNTHFVLSFCWLFLGKAHLILLVKTIPSLDLNRLFMKFHDFPGTIQFWNKQTWDDEIPEGA